MIAQPEDWIRKTAQVLRAHGAAEVYLFGSRAGEGFAADSDLDLAVKGLPDEVFFRAYAKACLECPVELDLLSLDRPNPFTDFLLTEGPLVRVA